jgi:quinol monooxygenase YgiN
MYKTSEEAYCVEYFYAKPGCREQLLAGLLTLVAPSKAESGCLQYDLLLDNKDPNLIILIVKFSNPETMKAHENNNFIQEFAEGVMKQYCEKFTWNDAVKVIQ